MQVFDGITHSDWEIFIGQFHRISKDRHWKKSKRFQRFFDCLSGAALKYASRLKVTSWKKLLKEMERRFSNKEDETTARLQLSNLRQMETESLEEFAERVQFKAMDAFVGESSHTIDKICVLHFLRGISDKHAAERASESNPRLFRKH